MKKLIPIMIIPLLISGCFTNKSGKTNKSEIGAIGGGIAGALLGSTIGDGAGKSVAIAGGAILGSLAGSYLGKSMDQKDLEIQQRKQHEALENNKTGSTTSWQNPDSQASGSITPTNTFKNHAGQNCREYTQNIKIGEKTEKVFGTACRRHDGSWEVLQ
jgi:surface antigen